MTLTDSPPADSGSAHAGAVAADATRPSGDASSPARVLARPVMTSDAAVVGRLYVGASLVLALATAVIGVLLALVRADGATPQDLFGGINSYFRIWTLYRVSFVLLVVMPLLLGVAMAVVPSQVGAGNVAFPRAALASFWSWLIGAVIVVSSVLAGGGWGALDGVTGNERDAMALTLLGTSMVIVALLVGAATVATTVISLREPGLSLRGVPPFAWSMLVAAAVWLFTLPIAIANIVIIYADLRGRPAIAFGQAESPEIWLQLDWMVEQPAVYAMAVPVLGIAVEAVSSAVGAKSSRPDAITVAVGLFGLLAVGGWSQDFFTAPADHRDGLLYVVFGLAAVVPVAAVLGGVADLVARGARTPDRLAATKFVGAVAALLLLAGAALSGGLRVIEPLDLLDTSVTWGVFNGVVVASLVAGAVAIWHWAPRLLGRGIGETFGRVAVVLLLAGGTLLAAPDVVSGFRTDWPELMTNSPDIYDSVGRALTAVSFAGSILVVAGLSIVLAGVASAFRGPVVTLEGSESP